MRREIRSAVLFCLLVLQFSTGWLGKDTSSNSNNSSDSSFYYCFIIGTGAANSY